MEPRVSLITLGVRDLGRSRQSYEALGWTTGPSPEDVVFFQAGGVVLALWDRTRLAEDSGVEDGGGWGGVAFAYSVRSVAACGLLIRVAKGHRPSQCCNSTILVSFHHGAEHQGR